MSNCNGSIEWNPTLIIGDTWQVSFQYTDDAGDPEPQPGYSASLMLRTYPDSPDVVADWSSYFTTSPDESEFVLSVPPAETRTLTARTYSVDFQIATAGDADVHTHAYGSLRAIQDVTRP